MTTSSPGQGPDQQPVEPVYADRVFRSVAGMVCGGLMLAVAAWIGGDALVRGEGRAPWLALAALLLALPLIVAFTLRPAVFANDDRLRIRNPFRTIVLPWAAVAAVRAGYSSEVFTQEGTKYQLWAVPVSLGKRKRAARRQTMAAHDDPHGRTSVTADVTDTRSRLAPADQTIADLREMSERCASRPGAQGEPQVRWAYEVIAPAVAGAILLVVLLAIG
ncbi:PH domain-containing protein [Streptomyces sp. NPDC059828]|uniref:PH domain-containing protein n=1 Tax=Streptomyces sp. NPDC059828 TaxID=3346965 RepID=UPI003669E3C2